MGGFRWMAAALAAGSFVAAGLLAGCGGSSPAAGSSADRGGDLADFVFENPLARVEVGEWARYRFAGTKAEGGRILTQTVLAVDPNTRLVRIREEYRDPETDQLDQSLVTEIHPNHFLWGFDSSGAYIESMRFERIRVAGRDWRCLRIDWIQKLQGPIRSWYSAEAPVLGLVKQVKVTEQGEYPNVELLDWSTR